MGTIVEIPFAIKSKKDNACNREVIEVLTRYFEHCAIGKYLRETLGQSWSGETIVFNFTVNRIKRKTLKMPHLVEIRDVTVGRHSLELWVGVMGKEKGAAIIHLQLPDSKINVIRFAKILKDGGLKNDETAEVTAPDNYYYDPINAPAVTADIQTDHNEENVKIILLYINELGRMSRSELNKYLFSLTGSENPELIASLVDNGYIREDDNLQWILTDSGRELVRAEIEELARELPPPPPVIVLRPAPKIETVRKPVVPSPLAVDTTAAKIAKLRSDADRYQHIKSDIVRIDGELETLKTTFERKKQEALQALEKDYKEKTSVLNELKNSHLDAVKNGKLDQAAKKIAKIDEALRD